MKTGVGSLYLATALTGLAFFAAPAALSDPALDPGLNAYGMPGMIEMPAAPPRPDAELSGTVAYSGNEFLKSTLSFQITPRLTGSFRYSKISNFRGGGDLFDRSFSLHYLIATEGELRPALSLGLNDILGTGVFASEYLVASKTVTPRLRFSGGIGWGRLGGVNSFDNPLGFIDDRLETRDTRDFGKGGTVELDQLFSGDAALFGGVEYQATDRLKLMAEYSSDAYEIQDGVSFDRRSPLNFGVTYEVNDHVAISAQYLYGSVFGVQLTLAVNPNEPVFPGGREGAPPPVLERSLNMRTDLGWTDRPELRAQVRDRLLAALAEQGLILHGVTLNATAARVEIENPTYNEWSQAVGRTARVMTRQLPGSIERFEIVPVKETIPTAEVVIRRSDMEELEFAFDNTWKSFARAEFNSTDTPLNPLPARYPDFAIDLKPYATPSFFDPDSPLRLDLGAEVAAEAQIMPGLSAQGAVRQRLLGNVGDATREADSPLPRVRSETYLYNREELTLPMATASYLFRPGEDLFGRVTVGYLEPQFGGVSTELLWKPVDSRLGLGVELNYVKQRDFDQHFGFRPYEVATGHASLYYDFENGYEVQLDAGRYLAGDWGATLSLNRTFANGWEVGAFATLTDVPFDEFGEGSFDKGITIRIPVDFLTGQPTRRNLSTTLRPILRDGGARLNVADRLYNVVEDTHRPDMADTWGRFWR